MHVKEKEMVSGLILPHSAFHPKLVFGRIKRQMTFIFEISSSISFLIFTLLCPKKLLEKGFDSHSKKLIGGSPIVLSNK